MYQPHGRYRYTYGVVSLFFSDIVHGASRTLRHPQNWRAAAAMIVSVPPMMPGLINSINTNIHVGVGARVFDLAYLLGVSERAILLVISTLTRSFQSRAFNCRMLYCSSLCHRPSISRSRGFSPLTKRCSITLSSSRRRSHTTGDEAFPAAMKRRRLMIIGLTSPSRPLHSFWRFASEPKIRARDALLSL